ncbi:PH domain-containing protein [Nonomuraea longicatena]|uniref:YdbS-like PH domain-containing protein n=1 Tax=Nonomuraea longicatena TaxID=83682 RepID=A0ABP4A8U3_9ACTN
MNPAVEEVREDDGWRTLCRRSLAASAVMSLGLAVPAAFFLGRALVERGWSPLSVAALVAGLAVLVVCGVSAFDYVRLRTTRWRLTGERLEVRSGFVERHHRSVPRERVRSVDITADPVRRVFGLAVVKVGTGEQAGGQSELSLDPLLRTDAEALRRLLLDGELSAGVSPDTSPGASLGAQDPAVARLDWSWARFAPLTVWSFVGGAILLGAGYKALGLFGLDETVEERLGPAWDWAIEHPWTAVPAVLLVNVLVGLLGAVIHFAAAWGGYRLEREPGRLRLRRGLLTTRSLTLEERRLRGVEVAEPLLLRLGGGARVKAVATGLGKTDDEENEDVAALSPPMPREHAWRVASAVAFARPEAGVTVARPDAGGASPRPGADDAFARPLADGAAPAGPRLTPHPRAARGRRIRWALSWVALVAAAVAALDLMYAWMPAWAWAAPAALLPVALLLALDAYRGLGHTLTAGHLVARSGSAVRSTLALERAGVVGWTVRGSYFQRRAGLLTLTATTAAGRGHLRVHDIGQDAGLTLAAQAVPGLLEPFVTRRADASG